MRTEAEIRKMKDKIDHFVRLSERPSAELKKILKSIDSSCSDSRFKDAVALIADLLESRDTMFLWSTALYWVLENEGQNQA